MHSGLSTLRCPIRSTRRHPPSPPARRVILRHRKRCNARGKPARLRQPTASSARGIRSTQMADTHAKHHDYHLVNPSPWPAVGATAAFVTAVGLIVWVRSMHGEGVFGVKGPSLFCVGGAGLLFTMFMWWRDVIKEAHGGDHTPVVQLHLRYGMILFIASEVMFFVAWFWGYFDAALFPGAVHPLDITGPDGTVEAGKEIIGMVKRDELFGGHWPPRPGEGAATTAELRGACAPRGPPFVHERTLA